MKTLLLPLLLMPVLAASGELMEYRLSPVQGNRLVLEVTKTGVYGGRKHLLEFGTYAGEVRFDNANPAQSKVRFEVRAADIAVRDTWLSDSDRVKVHDYAVNDMLQSKSHPLIQFASTGVEAAGDAMKVTGNLTIRGQSRPVMVMVRQKDSGDGHLMFEGESSFRMSIFGLKPPTAAFGLIGTKDLMDLKFLLKVVRE